MLKQLASGDWVDLKEVIVVRHYPEESFPYCNVIYPPRVVVYLKGDNEEKFVINFSDVEHAIRYRDELAKECNDAVSS